MLGDRICQPCFHLLLIKSPNLNPPSTVMRRGLDQKLTSLAGTRWVRCQEGDLEELKEPLKTFLFSGRLIHPIRTTQTQVNISGLWWTCCTLGINWLGTVWPQCLLYVRILQATELSWSQTTLLFYGCSPQHALDISSVTKAQPLPSTSEAES